MPLVIMVLSSMPLLCQTIAKRVPPDLMPVDSLLKAAVQQHKISGAVALVEWNGEILMHSAFGYSNIEEGQRMETNSIFRLASMTKGLTAVAVLQLAEKGLIDLDAPVEAYLPEFGDMKVLDSVLKDSSFLSSPAVNEIQIRHLLTHTSGIGYGFQDEQYNMLVIQNGVSEGFCEDSRSSAENTKLIAGLPLLAEPGERYIYSMSFDVLGTIVEKVSGKRFDNYIAEHIMLPLEMHDSYFVIPKDKRQRLVAVYEPDESDGLRRTRYTDIEYPLIDHRRFFSGGADLCGTAGDFLNFMTMIENRGLGKDIRILGSRYVDMMLSKQSDLAEEDSYQGFGTWITNHNGEIRGPFNQGTFGFGGFFDTYAWVDPAAGLKAVLLLQMYPANEDSVHEKFQNLVYQSLASDDNE